MEQKQEGRLGFFKRMFLAITDFRLYPYVQREKVSAAVAYFTLLTVFVTIFLALFFSNQILNFASDIFSNYDDIVPEFTLKNGELDVIEKTYNVDNDSKFVIDTYMTNEEFASTEIGKEVVYSNAFTVINKDGIMYGTKDATLIFLFKPITDEITRDTLYNYLKLINEDWTIKAAIISVTWLGFFIAYYIIKTINTLFLIIMAWIINTIFGMKLKFGNYYRVVVYSLTLPMLIELISILYLGRLPSYASFVYQLLAYVYIFYALRALKLDILITTSSGATFKEKIENMIQKLENDVEEKMKKQAEESKEEKNEENNSDENDKKDNEKEK